MLGFFLYLIQVKVVLLERRLGRLTNHKRCERGKGPKRLDWTQGRSAVSETEMELGLHISLITSSPSMSSTFTLLPYSILISCCNLIDYIPLLPDLDVLGTPNREGLDPQPIRLPFYQHHVIANSRIESCQQCWHQPSREFESVELYQLPPTQSAL